MQPIGIHWEEMDFTNHTLDLQKHDTIYVFSDGMVDQLANRIVKNTKPSTLKSFCFLCKNNSLKTPSNHGEKTTGKSMMFVS